MPVVRVKSNGAWVEVDGVSNHAHPEYAPVDTLSELQVGVEELYDGVEELKVGSEELQICIEELYAGIEEVQVSAEELQSSVEELHTGVEDLQLSIADLHNVLEQKSDMDHQHTASEVGALPIEGGTMEGTLTLSGIVLTEGIDFGSGDPRGGVFGQLYFKKVT